MPRSNEVLYTARRSVVTPPYRQHTLPQCRHNAAAVCMARPHPYTAALRVVGPVSTLLLRDTCAVANTYEAVEVVVQQQQQCDVFHLGMCTEVLERADSKDNLFYFRRPVLQCMPPLLTPSQQQQQQSHRADPLPKAVVHNAVYMPSSGDILYTATESYVQTLTASTHYHRAHTMLWLYA
jgi:hypothetical protein